MKISFCESLGCRGVLDSPKFLVVSGSELVKLAELVAGANDGDDEKSKQLDKIVFDRQELSIVTNVLWSLQVFDGDDTWGSWPQTSYDCALAQLEKAVDKDKADWRGDDNAIANLDKLYSECKSKWPQDGQLFAVVVGEEMTTAVCVSEATDGELELVRTALHC